MPPKNWITILYVLGAVLPLYGIGHALSRVAGPAIDHWSYQRKLKALQKQGRKRVAAAPLAERSKVEAETSYWMGDEVAKITGPGETNFLGYVNNNAVSYQKFKNYLYDLGFVGGGIVAAGVASIWSLWL